MKFWTLVLAVFMMLAGFSAEAARLGGGRSVGRQSSNVTQRQAAPTQGATATPVPAPAPAAPAPVAPRKPWGSMLGGLAAGLGLAWLASSLGLGGGAIAQFLLFALLAMLVMARHAFPAGDADARWGWRTVCIPVCFVGPGGSHAGQLPAGKRWQ